MAPKFDRPCTDFPTRCGYDLFLNHVTESDLFRNRVLYLYPCIHLHEIEVQIFIHDEFDSSCPFIVDCLTGIDGGLSHLLPNFSSVHRGGSFLQNFLMATLKCTLSFTHVYNMTVMIPTI